MNAVMYGAGNIGRGFIGMLLSQAGYRVTFIDIAEPVVKALQEENTYPVRYVSGEGYEDVWVENVTAVNGKDETAAAQAIAGCDIMATAVGARILPFIVPNIVAGLRLRWAQNKGPLNIIICENLMDANKVLENLLREQLTQAEQALFTETVGLVEASIGRMVPVQTEEMKDGHPLRVCVEQYGYLPVDKDGFRGEIPQIPNMVPVSPFDFYIKRKLYLHNMGHATCAYLGDLLGLTYIYESIAVPEISLIVKNAMLESAAALADTYGTSIAPILEHVDDLLHRFTNQALQDTCARVGGDPARKLSGQDRLIGSGTLVAASGNIPAYIAVGAAAGLRRLAAETGISQSLDNGKDLLLRTSGLTETDTLTGLILSAYQQILDGCSITQLWRWAENQKAAGRRNVI